MQCEQDRHPAGDGRLTGGHRARGGQTQEETLPQEGSDLQRNVMSPLYVPAILGEELWWVVGEASVVLGLGQTRVQILAPSFIL